jgi:hypothetical protein
MPLKDLNIALTCPDLSWGVFTLQKNTLRILDAIGRFNPSNRHPSLDASFVRTFVATQWHSLSSLRCASLCFTLDRVIYLPSLRILELDRCRVEGWENLCSSVTVLEKLKLKSNEFVGLRTSDILSTLPRRIGRNIEVFEIRFDHSIKDHDASWFSAYASSFTRLREFSTDQISVETLTALLKHCPSLETLHFYAFPASNALLKILSKQMLLNLKSVTLHGGKFSSEVLADFVKSCPILQYLSLYTCQGLTPSILRAMFQLPLLRELSLGNMSVREEYLQELNRISHQEKPVQLKNFSYSYYYS